MSAIVISSAQRRSIRRSVTTPCWAIRLDDCSLLGEQLLDLSPRGMLLAGQGEVELGKEIFISFKAPGHNNLWLNAEAEVARVVNGWRVTDPGYCLGLRLTYFDIISRVQLERRLRGLPPPVPRRRLRKDYAETVRHIAWSSYPDRRPYTALANRLRAC